MSTALFRCPQYRAECSHRICLLSGIRPSITAVATRGGDPMNKLRKCLAGTSVALALGLTALSAGAQEVKICGELTAGYGPFDYRVETKRLELVERFHFRREQENLTKRPLTGLASNLSYTLNSFPNHHRALMAMMKLGFREKAAHVRGATYSVECYMIRGERWRPDDPMVKTIHGLFLLQSGRAKEAIAKFEAARGLDTNNANVNYNLGLAYLQLKEYDKALESAHRAYAQGFPLPGLRDKLQRIGKWRDLDVQKASAGGEGGSK